MKKVFLMLVIMMATISCKSQEIILNREDISKYSEIITKRFQTFDAFKEIHDLKDFKLTEDEVLKKNFIEAVGLNEKNLPLVLRFNVDVKELSNGSLSVSFISDNEGESCSGVNCNYCFFKKGGGCGCNQIGGDCNHTITR